MGTGASTVASSDHVESLEAMLARLPAKQRAFAVDFLKTRNATESYRKVYGATDAVAETNGSRLLRNARVGAVIAAYLSRQEKKALLEVERIDANVAASAEFDPLDILDPATGHALPVHQWPERARRALAGWEEEPIFADVPTGELGPRGGVITKPVQIGVRKKFKWNSKNDATRLAYQRLGVLTEKHEISGPANVSINIGVRRGSKSPAARSASSRSAP
jgi:phage terminase small subunit